MNNTEVASAAIRICKIKLPVPGSKYANTGSVKLNIKIIEKKMRSFI